MTNWKDSKASLLNKNKKLAELKREEKIIENKLRQVKEGKGINGDMVVSAFDFSQNLASIWKRSNFENKRAILDLISSNRTLGHLSLDIAWTKPYDFLANNAFLQNGGGKRHLFEPNSTHLNQLIAAFKQMTPNILAINEIMYEAV